MKGLKGAYERIVPHAVWAVQNGCQRLGVMSNDTDTVMHFTDTLVRDNLKKTSRSSLGQVRRETSFPYIASGRADAALFCGRLTYSLETMSPAELAPSIHRCNAVPLSIWLYLTRQRRYRKRWSRKWKCTSYGVGRVQDLSHRLGRMINCISRSTRVSLLPMP